MHMTYGRRERPIEGYITFDKHVSARISTT